MSIPSATYRLQLHRGFGFAEAREVATYLDALGVSHLYLSPITAAVPGSRHGYDVVDPTRLNPDLGGEHEWRALVRRLEELGLGVVLDVVPNHMGAATENRWWADVLRRGEASPYARIYDIDWQAPTAGGEPRVLLPVLGERLERVLERGEIGLEVTPEGEPQLRYFDRTLPLAPESLALVDADEEGHGGAPAVERLHARRQTEEGRETLRALLDAQHYRLEYWRDAAQRVNYRRFFVIDQLVGLRAEDPTVFGVTHALLLRLATEGAVDGMRIDHIDGLADPERYLERLHDALGVGEQPAAERVPRYVVVEKVLAAGEALPEDWRCDGTTGYDFMRDVSGVFLDPAAAPRLTEVFEAITGETASYDDVAYQCRRATVDGPISGQLHTVSAQLFDTSGAGARGVERDAFDEALRVLLASMNVYRTYHSASAPDPEARRHVEAARARAVGRIGSDAASALALVSEVLAQPQPAAIPMIERLQQLMPTVQAKGIEDTATYRYPRLLSLSEVGTSPGDFGLDVAMFHARNLERHGRWPASMLATATHDHKRGEDARARLNVLAELSEEFAAALARWHEMTADVRPLEITALDEYVIHQVLLGSWPPGPFDEAARAAFLPRVQDYLVKFGREAGVRTGWDAPDAAYEDALCAYAAALLDPAMSARFLDDRAALQRRVSTLGAVNSLGQVMLRVASPGVPDTYQGTEGWDLSMVDPDNRRPVDFGRQAAALRSAFAASDAPEARARIAQRLLHDWPSGGVKQLVLARALRHRRDAHPFYIDAAYVPLEVRGEHRDHVVAFARVLDGRVAVAAVTRLPASLPGQAEWRPRWGDTHLVVPAALAARTVVDVYTGGTTRLEASTPVAELCHTLPVALLAEST